MNAAFLEKDVLKVGIFEIYFKESFALNFICGF